MYHKDVWVLQQAIIEKKAIAGIQSFWKVAGEVMLEYIDGGRIDLAPGRAEGSVAGEPSPRAIPRSPSAESLRSVVSRSRASDSGSRVVSPARGAPANEGAANDWLRTASVAMLGVQLVLVVVNTLLLWRLSAAV